MSKKIILPIISFLMILGFTMCFFNTSLSTKLLNFISGSVKVSTTVNTDNINTPIDDTTNSSTFTTTNNGKNEAYIYFDFDVESDNDLSKEPLKYQLIDKSTNKSIDLVLDKIIDGKAVYKTEKDFLSGSNTFFYSNGSNTINQKEYDNLKDKTGYVKTVNMKQYELLLIKNGENIEDYTYDFTLTITAKSSETGFKDIQVLKFHKDKVLKNYDIFTYNIITETLSDDGSVLNTSTTEGPYYDFNHVPSSTNDLNVGENENKKIEITGLTTWYQNKLKNGEETGFTIPTLYHNLPVYDIKENSFNSLTTPYTVDFENGVEIIEKNAFNEENLKNKILTLPSSLKELGSRNFEELTLDELEVNSTIEASVPFKNSTIKNIKVKNTDKITDTLFASIKGITDFTIPDRITSIGSNAFANSEINNLTMNHLPSMNLSNNKSVFQGAIIDNLTLNNITTISENMFNSTDKINHLNITKQLTSVGKNAFANINYIGNFTYDDTITSWSNAFNNTNIGELTFSDGVSAISSYAFQNTKSIEILNTGSVVNIEQNAFSDIGVINNIQLPKVQKIGYRSFENIKNIENITIPKTLQNTGDEYHPIFCNSILNHVYFEDGLTTLPPQIFKNCTIIGEDFTLKGSSITGLNSFVFQGCDLSACKNFDLSNITFIKWSVFENTKFNKDAVLTIPKTLTSTDGYNDWFPAFNGTTIYHLKFEDGITTLPNYLFMNAIIVDPDFTLKDTTITSIKEKVFSGADLSACPDFDLSFVLQDLNNSFSNTKFNEDTILTIPKTLTNCYEPFNGIVINHIQIEDGMTALPNTLFKYATINDPSFVLPSSLTSIGNNTFEGTNISVCKNLSFENITSIGNYTFKNTDLSTLKDFNLPTNLQYIGDNAFEKTTFKQDIVLTIPKTLTNCGNSPFNGQSFNDIQYQDGITVIANKLFQNCTIDINNFILPSSITTIGDYAFNNTNLSTCTKFDLPEALTTIGSNAFNNTDLSACTDFALPDTLTTLGESAFNSVNLSACTNFTLKNTAITSINASTFENADLSASTNFDLPTNLKELRSGSFNNTKFNKNAVITIPKTLTYIDKNWENKAAFTNSTIYHLEIEDGMTTLPDNIFSGTIISDPTFTLKDTTITTINGSAFDNTDLSACIKFDLPSNLETLSNGSFYYTKFNTNAVITIPKTLKNVNKSWDNKAAFNGSTIYHLQFEDGLTTIPNYLFIGTTIADPNFTLKDTTITTIKENAFLNADLSNCIKFELPINIETVENNAFNGCKLSNVYIYNKTVDIQDNAFANSTTTIYGYTNSTAQTYSNNFGNTFVEITE